MTIYIYYIVIIIIIIIIIKYNAILKFKQKGKERKWNFVNDLIKGKMEES